MFLALFAFGTLWFWLIVAFAVISIIISVENDSSGFSILSLLGLFAFLDFVAKIPLISYLLHHPVLVLLLIVLYIGVGVGWSVTKWYFFLRKYLIKLKEEQQKYLDDRSIKNIEDATAEQRETFNYRTKSSDYYNPKVSRYKSTIIFWMSYWPFSVIGTLLNDFFRKIFHHLYGKIAASLQRMSDKVFSGVKVE